jgi:hypothetical protein
VAIEEQEETGNSDNGPHVQSYNKRDVRRNVGFMLDDKIYAKVANNIAKHLNSKLGSKSSVQKYLVCKN